MRNENGDKCEFVIEHDTMMTEMVDGGTFALYSLICQHAKISHIPNQLPSDARISSFRTKVHSSELERSLKFKETLENSLPLKKLFLMLVLANTSTVIDDGVGMPAISLSFSGLKVGVSDIKKGNLVSHSSKDLGSLI
ncbi:hypothetical protein ACFE04_000908 [Oxalis oulophora]